MQRKFYSKIYNLANAIYDVRAGSGKLNPLLRNRHRRKVHRKFPLRIPKKFSLKKVLRSVDLGYLL